jgi:regulator of protease activity HflC (stomatin/prohibitin superfamily)
VKRKINWLVITPASIIIFVGVIMSPGVRYRVGKDERAVLFNRLSGDLDQENIIGPGRGLKFPWNELHIYNISETQLDEEFDILDKHGRFLRVKITVRFFPMPDKIGFLDEKFGEHYTDILIIPEARSVVRQICGRYSAEDVYSSKRDEVVQEINKEAEMTFKENSIQLDELLIRSVELPAQLREELEKKSVEK